MKSLIFKFPTLKESLETTNVYDETYKSCLEKGILTKNQMLIHLFGHNIFTPKMQGELESLEKSAIFKYPRIKKFDNHVEENRYIEKVLMEIIAGERLLKFEELFEVEKKEETKEELRYRNLSILKNQYMKYTCESIADNARLIKLISYCVYDGETEKKIWKSFSAEKNKLLFAYLTVKLTEFLGGFSSSILRKLAKHPLWRTKWISATKIGTPIFDGNISEWDINKTYLCYWSNFYDNIYGSYEPIEDHIIENDELLDNYLEAKNNDRKNGGKIASAMSDQTKTGVVGVFKNQINTSVFGKK